MTPIPIKPTCICINPFLHELFHIDNDSSARNDHTFLVMHMLHFALVGCGNRMFHFHGAENDKHLMGGNAIAILNMHFDDGARHCALSVFCEWAAPPPYAAVSTSGGWRR